MNTSIIITPSTRKYKKFMAVFPGGKAIHFGDNRYEDFTMHRDKSRKDLYILRHSAREDWNNTETAGFWSRWVLWNKPSLISSIKDTEKRFGIQIIYLSNYP